MVWMDDRHNRKRHQRGQYEARNDTALLHTRLRDARAMELHAHVSRVASCVVITDVATMSPRRRHAAGASLADQLCVMSGDAVGNLSLFYITLQELCTHDAVAVEGARPPRRRPDVKFRGAHRGTINCMLHIKGTPLVLTGGDDGAVRLWNVREDLVEQSKLLCVQEYWFHSSCVVACDADPSQTFFVTAGLDGVVAIWLRDTPIPLLTIPIGDPCSGISIVPEDPSLIRVVHQDQISVWDLRAQPHYIHFQRALAHQVRARLEGTDQHTRNTEMCLLERLQSAFPSYDDLIWLKASASMKRCLMRLNVSGAPPPITSRQFDEVSQRFVPIFANHHGIASFQLSNHHSPESTSAEFTPTGTLCHAERFLYGADGAGGVHVWDLRASIASFTRRSDATILPTHCIHGHVFFVTSITLSHDDTVLVTGDASGKLHVRVASD